MTILDLDNARHVRRYRRTLRRALQAGYTCTRERCTVLLTHPRRKPILLDFTGEDAAREVEITWERLA